MKDVNFEMTVRVKVPGEDKPREKTVQYVAPQVESILDASRSLPEYFRKVMSEREVNKLKPLQLEKIVDGKTVKYDANAEELATDYIVNAIRAQQKLDVSGPLRMTVADELYPEKKQEAAITKFAEDIVERRKVAGKPISMERALEIAREAYEG